LHPNTVAEQADHAHDSPRRTDANIDSPRPKECYLPTVLLVDDERPVRTALRKILERGGFTVREAESGREALEALSDDPGIGAVVSDFIMPELDGLDFYDALVARTPHLRHRVVFLTGAARDPTVHQPLEDRGVPLINKLDDLNIVLDAVKLVLLRPSELP
jgi:CheY-like chemotaxis protein